MLYYIIHSDDPEFIIDEALDLQTAAKRLAELKALSPEDADGYKSIAYYPSNTEIRARAALELDPREAVEYVKSLDTADAMRVTIRITEIMAASHSRDDDDWWKSFQHALTEGEQVLTSAAKPVRAVIYKSGWSKWSADLDWDNGDTWLKWQSGFETQRELVENITAVYGGLIEQRV